MTSPPSAIALDMPAEHPMFAGHFPGMPIVPGAWLLAQAIAALEAAWGRRCLPGELANAKFLAPVGPGARLTVDVSVAASGALQLVIREGARNVATASLRVAEEGP